MGRFLKRQRLARVSSSMLGEELWMDILENVGAREALRLSGVCKQWMIGFDVFWKFVCNRDMSFSWFNTAPVPNWRMEFLNRYMFIHSFRRGNCQSGHIRMIDSHDDVVYMNTQILVDKIPPQGIFVDVLVKNICDNISLSLVDFDGVGGCSSLTFSPDTGTVIKERKLSESPRRIVGEYFQCLSSCHQFGTNSDQAGHLAAFISHSQAISFYRKHFANTFWETTGIVSDCQWVDGGQITPCIAFRDAGSYDIQINRVCVGLPWDVASQVDVACNEVRWKPIGWLRNEESDAESTSETAIG